MTEVVVVIGPGQIGQAIVRRVGVGKHVLLADVRKENATAAAEVLENVGYEVSVATVDASSREDVHSLVEAATARGDVTRLIHAAGVSPTQASPTTILKVDLYGPERRGGGDLIAVGAPPPPRRRTSVASGPFRAQGVKPMTNLGFSRCAFGMCAAVAMLAGCGGSQRPIGAPGAMPQSPASATHAARGGSWMLPEAKTGDLLYVSIGNTVDVLSYPRVKLLGTLAGFNGTAGECIDKAQDVWIVNEEPAKVIEYAHGGTSPIATLSDPNALPIGCSVDPTTGNLALTDGVGVTIYRGAQGPPTTYTAPGFYQYWYCAYDRNGDLFVSGIIAQGPYGYGLAELPRGGSSFVNITLNQAIKGGPISLQWNNKVLVASADDDGRGPQEIYQIALSGTTGTIVRTISLDNNQSAPEQGVQYWVQGGKIIGPANRFETALGFWNYPQGGKWTKLKRYAGAWGVVVSLGPK